MHFTSINPALADDAIVWQGEAADTVSIQKAVATAHAAFSTWCLTPLDKRISLLEQFARHVESQRAVLATQISRETGKPYWESLTEVTAVIAKIAISIQAYQERTADKITPGKDGNIALHFKPHGVVVVLGAFNFPAHLSNGHIVPALLAGNTVLYKPSELAPGVADIIMACWDKAGLPKGVIQCLQGDANVAKQLLQQDIQGVYFTGSYQAGKQIHASFAGRPEIILALEMGGNNPLIVEPVSDMQSALYTTLLSTLLTAGQRCSCARRVFIPDNTWGDAFLAELTNAYQHILVGPFTTQPEPFMGPVIRFEHAQKHLAAQAELIALGGKALLSMQSLQARTGLLSPGIIDMTAVADAPDREIFAPLTQIYRYDTLDTAIQLANHTQYGLVAGLISENPEHYKIFFQQIRAGLINWNKPTTGASSQLPFGGIGWSGNHRPSAYFAADYCAYPVAIQEQATLQKPITLLPGIQL